MDQPMLYTEFHPRPELKPWVAAHWYFRVEPGTPEMDHWIPPNGGVLLSVSPEGTMLSGPRTEPFPTRVQGGLQTWGSILWPGAAGSLLGLDVAALRSHQVPAALELDPQRIQRLEHGLSAVREEAEAAEVLDAFFLEGLPPGQPLDGPVMEAVFHLLQSNGEAPIGEVAAAVHLSPRQLRRRFRRAVGLTAKELARVQRVRASAVEAVLHCDEPWGAIAAHRGFADQAHLIREFRDLLGVTPGGFESHFRRIHHGKLVR
jgi:AraC-like DNA-binding protein